MKENLVSALAHFKIDGKLLTVEPYGEGHINETYLAVYDAGGEQKRYILQKINSNLFNPVEKLMENISGVTNFLREKIIARGGDADRKCLTLVLTVDGATFYKSEASEYFRVYKFIEHTVCLQKIEKPEHFYNSAVAFGEFMNELSEYDASKIYEILPNFHNTPKRYNDFLAAVDKDEFNRAKDCEKEIEFFKSHEELYPAITNLLNSGKIPLRVTHNDTKLNNVLLDLKSGKPVAVIDLDTIMPGSLLYDFGDSIRFGCNSALEDEPDLSKVYFREDLYKVYVDGYMSKVGASITETEKENLPIGAILMTMECGMRFLADYLSGDVYFKTHRSGQNLDRARTQIKLASDMLKKLDELKKYALSK